MAIWHPLIRRYRKIRDRNRLRREMARLAALNEPFFSRDHVGFKTAIWEQHLSEFAGSDGLQMLEIGSYEGRSAIWFVEHILTGKDCRLTCVDPWPDVTKLRFDHNLHVTGHSDRVRAIQKGSEHALLDDLVDESFDLIYIDGSHRAPNVLFDAVFAWPLLAQGGVMLFDDYGWRPDLPAAERPKPSVDRFMQLFGDEMEIIEVGFQVLVKKTN